MVPVCASPKTMVCAEAKTGVSAKEKARKDKVFFFIKYPAGFLLQKRCGLHSKMTTKNGYALTMHAQSSAENKQIKPIKNNKLHWITLSRNYLFFYVIRVFNVEILNGL